MEHYSIPFPCDRSFHAPMCSIHICMYIYLGRQVGIGMSKIARIQYGASFDVSEDNIVTQNEMRTNMRANLSFLKEQMTKKLDYLSQ